MNNASDDTRERNRQLSHVPAYQIKIQGHLGPQWAEWFEDLTVTLETSGVTVLTGPVADQAALYGLLRKIHTLGMPLLSVMRVEADAIDQ